MRALIWLNIFSGLTVEYFRPIEGAANADISFVQYRGGGLTRHDALPLLSRGRLRLRPVWGRRRRLNRAASAQQQ
jgi:hypothetical protein